MARFGKLNEAARNFLTDFFSFSMKLLNLALICSAVVESADVDCYKLLGVTKKDTSKKIKSAYRLSFF